MLKKATRLLAILLVVMSVATCGLVNVYADEYEPSNLALYDDGNEIRVSDVISTSGDIKKYQVVIDHSIYPEVFLYAYTSGSAPGNTFISVSRESGSVCTSVNLTSIGQSVGLATKPKQFSSFSDSSGETKTYTVTAQAYSDDAGYTFIISPENNVAKYLGGSENAATIGSTVQEFGMTNYIMGIQAAMNGDGDWYRYTPTTNVATYVATRVEGEVSTAFQIYESETMKLIYTSNSDDRYTYTKLSVHDTIMQNRFQLTAGKEYLIRSYAPTSIGATDEDTYRVYIGLPSVRDVRFDYTHPTTYTISPNRTTTIKINVTGFTDLLRLCSTSGTSISFSAGSFANNQAVTSCTIIAPNGTNFDATRKVVTSSQLSGQPDLEDFLNNPFNIPLDGVWTIQIRTSKTLKMEFSMKGTAVALNRMTAPSTAIS